ncbi:MAG: TonB-dependent receptor [Actinobacteria bacterium]|nr:TonB-dependent receptor [Actinomycetota bacterium]
MENMLRKVSFPLMLTCIVLFLFQGETLAGITGKIAGTVKDANTGEALPGVNVVILSTSMGAATDLDGNYFIINIPPGTYSVKASMMGYEDVTKTEVMVNADHTTTIGFDLKVSTIVGQEVTIVAQKEIVPMDVSASRIVAEAQEIARVPVVTDIAQYINLQAGIEGDIIRGGGLDQTQFMMDGLMVVDNRANKPLMMVNLSAVKELNIIKGGFNAEYGNVRSGLINVITKEGSPTEYNGSIDFRLSPPHLKHGGPSLFSPENYFLKPYLDPAVCWVGTKNGAWDEGTQRQYPEFMGWNAYSEKLLSDDNPSNDMTPAEARDLFLWQHAAKGSGKLGQKEGKYGNKPDWNADASFGGPVPIIGKYLGNLSFFASYRNNWEMFALPTNKDYYKEQNSQLKFISRLSPSMKLVVEGLYGEINTVAAGPFSGRDYYLTSGNAILNSSITGNGEDGIKGSHLYFPSALSPFNIYRSMEGVAFDHILSPSTFYNVRVSHTRIKNFSNGWDRTRDTTIVKYFGNYGVDEQPWGYWDEGGSRRTMDGKIYIAKAARTRDWSDVNTFNLKFDLTSQINTYNQTKIGFLINYDDINNDYGYKEPAAEFRTWWRKSRKFPIRAGAYVQDKLEFEGMIANFGIRLDYNDPNTNWYTVDRYSDYFRKQYTNVFTQVAPEEPAKGHLKVSPRLGISHPISANAKLYFNYGHFYSMPRSADMYEIDYGVSGATNGIRFIGNPSADLPKTVAYELGWEYNLMDLLLFHVAGYYKDVSDQTGSVSYVNYDGSVNYRTIENNNYADIRGFEIRIDKRFGQWVTGWLNYNYIVTKSGYIGRRTYYQDPRKAKIYGLENPYQERPIARPFLRTNLALTSPQNWGPTIASIRPLSDINLSLLFHWKAGRWMTYDPLYTGELQSNLQWRDNYSFDARVSKRMKIGKYAITLFADAFNLLNNQVFSTRAFADNLDALNYYKSLHLPMYDAPEYRQAGYTPGHDKPGDLKSKDKPYIDDPNVDFLKFLNQRSIFFGIKAEF